MKNLHLLGNLMASSLVSKKCYLWKKRMWQREKYMTCSQIKNLSRFRQKCCGKFDTYLNGRLERSWIEYLLLTQKLEISRIFEKDK